MLKSDFTDLRDHNFITKGGLEFFLRRLEKGMRLQGRIIDCLGDNRYLLRIRGYNILTYSEQLFNIFDDIQMKVVEVEPHLVLDLFKERCSPVEIVNKEDAITNILVY